MMGVPQVQSLEPELVNYLRQYDEAKALCQKLVAGLSPTQISWKPGSNRWSIAECLAHLNVTGELYLAALDRAIAHGRARGWTGHGPFRHGWLVQFFFIRALEPPVRRKFTAPRIFQPASGPDASEAVARFLALQDDLIKRIHAANGLDLARIKVTSPATRLLRMTLGQAFAAVAVHQRRHLLQARNVRDSHQFPGES
jgi:DinB superfamily